MSTFFPGADTKFSPQGSDITAQAKYADSCRFLCEHSVCPVLDLRTGVVILSDHRAKSTGGGDARTRCVLLAAGGEQPPERLLMLLDQPNTHTVTVAHPLLAAAELASLERERRSRKAWKMNSDERVVLVVVNRENWGDLSPLVRTVQIQMPNVSIWMCTEGAAMEIYSGSDPSNDDEDMGTQAPSTEDPDQDQPASDEPLPEESAGTDVTEDEIRFLLELYDADSNEDSDENSDDHNHPEVDQ